MRSNTEAPHKPGLWCLGKEKLSLLFQNSISRRGKAERAGLRLDELGCGWRVKTWKAKPQIKAVFQAWMTRKLDRSGLGPGEWTDYTTEFEMPRGYPCRKLQMAKEQVGQGKREGVAA